MARLAATAVLLLSLLAVASCRVLEAEPETVVAVSDEQGGQAGPAVGVEASDAAEAIPSLPATTVAEGILRLPSHRRPCRHGFLHRHLRWARHHGPSHRRDAFPRPGGDVRVHPAVVLPEEPREAVAEPDPDTRPETDGEQIPFHGEEEENESVKAWKGEMLRRFRGHGFRFHRRHHHHDHAEEKDDSDDKEQREKEEGAGDMQLQHVKMFSRHFHHHHDGDEEQEETARKHYIHHHHDSDNEVDQVEELARRLSKAIMSRSLSRGGIRHAEEGGVRKWFKGLMNMNRF